MYSPSHKVSVDVESFGPMLEKVKELMDTIDHLVVEKDLQKIFNHIPEL